MLTCPVCKGILYKEAQAFYCERGHRFDRSRKGSVNLLQSQARSTKQHGDDKQMVISRSRFLDKNYYNAILEMLLHHIPMDAQAGCDLGCGEGWYTAHVSQNHRMDLYGIDVSKVAIEKAASRSKTIMWVVGSTYDLPLASESMDVCWSIFAPFSDAEVVRVLKPGGYFIHVIPREDHLYELKEAIYDTVRPNDPVPVIETMTLIQAAIITDWMNLDDTQSILDLFSMTPYVYRTPKALSDKLYELQQLRVRIACDCRIYRKKCVFSEVYGD